MDKDTNLLKSEASRAYWQRVHEKKEEEASRRRVMEEHASRRRRMKEKCRDYIQQPIVGMSDTEAQEFARNVSDSMRSIIRIRDFGADDGRRMTPEETAHCRDAILDAIKYFNEGDAEHQRIMEYRETCRRAAEESRKRQEGCLKKKYALTISIV